MTEQRMITVEEAAKLLGVGRASGYRLARMGVLPTVRLGERLLRVPVTALERLLAGERPPQGGVAE